MYYEDYYDDFIALFLQEKICALKESELLEEV